MTLGNQRVFDQIGQTLDLAIISLKNIANAPLTFQIVVRMDGKLHSQGLGF